MIAALNRRGLFAAAAATALLATGCQEPEHAAPANVILHRVDTLPTESADPAWASAPEFKAPLIPQDMVEPRQMKDSTEAVRVRALTDGRTMALRMEWDDATKDNLPGPAHFFDACAIQLPADVQPTVPAPQMGEAGRPVHISYWNASWQAMVDGRQDSLSAIYPNAAVDHHPFEAESLRKDPAAQRAMAARYAPARALGNHMAGPRESPVQDLVGEGPSTLTPASQRISEGEGVKTPSGWSVVLRRPLPDGLSPDRATQIAFAVWRGEAQEVGARKMRTAWIPLAQEATP